MSAANQLAFASTTLDRAAHLRADTDALAAMWNDPQTLGFAYWQGKLLFKGADRTELAGLPMDHPLFGGAPDAPIFLGLTPDGPRFVFDISDWQPDDLPDEHGSFFDKSTITHPDAPPEHAFVDLRTQLAVLAKEDSEIAAAAKAIFGWHESHGYCAKCGQKTELEMAGWQRKCPTCETRHFPRTDPVVIMLATHGNNVLMGRSPGWPDGMFSLLAGFVEPGETIEAAARREVMEEVGVKIGQVDYLASQPWPFPASLMIGCKCQATSTEITIDPVEIEQARWFSREDMVDVFAGQMPGVFPARPGSIAHYLLKNWLADIGV